MECYKNRIHELHNHILFLGNSIRNKGIFSVQEQTRFSLNSENKIQIEKYSETQIKSLQISKVYRTDHKCQNIQKELSTEKENSILI